MSCSRCNRPGFLRFQGNTYCGLHFRNSAAKERCSICLEYMRTGELIDLECGHVHHKECLSKCVSACCPLCRDPFGSIHGPYIYYDTKVIPLMEKVFNCIPPHSTSHVFKMFHAVVDMCVDVGVEQAQTEVSNVVTNIINEFGTQLPPLFANLPPAPSLTAPILAEPSLLAPPSPPLPQVSNIAPGAVVPPHLVPYFQAPLYPPPFNPMYFVYNDGMVQVMSSSSV